jgi:hypothetical protein
MDMDKIKIILGALLLLLVSVQVNASIISYAGYTHNTDTDIVVGNGLEWLQWDLTTNVTISEANYTFRNTIENGRWDLANIAQLAQLFNDFSFGMEFKPEERIQRPAALRYKGPIQQTFYPAPDIDQESSPMWFFVNMFGDTRVAAGHPSFDFGEGGLISTGAWFGGDENGNNIFNYASVKDDYMSENGIVRSGAVHLSSDKWFDWQRYSGVGIALVRTSPVPVPSSILLFLAGLGLFVFRFARRRQF